MNEPAASFIAGVFAMGFAVLGVLFLRFWRKTGDSLFVCFAAAFWLLALGQLTLTLVRASGDETVAVYLPRLAAFALIIAAVVRKNLGVRGRSDLRRPGSGA